MQLERPGSALQHGLPAALKPLARDERCCPSLKSFKRAILASNPPGIWRMLVKSIHAGDFLRAHVWSRASAANRANCRS